MKRNVYVKVMRKESHQIYKVDTITYAKYRMTSSLTDTYGLFELLSSQVTEANKVNVADIKKGSKIYEITLCGY
jgi:hypothetical protein